MIELSKYEILVSIIVILVIIRPEDIPFIIKQLKVILNQIRKFKNIISDFFESFDDIEPEKMNLDNQDTINFYISRIAETGATYKGKYELKAIKKYYFKRLELIKKIEDDRNISSKN